MLMKNKLGLGLLIGVLIPLSVTALVGLAMCSNAHPEIGENKSQVKWLPVQATNVSYYKTYSWTAFEFDLAEDQFKTWASKWDMKEIASPRALRRYTFRTLKCPKYDTNPHGDYSTWESQTKVVITNGLFYQTPERANGGGTFVAYDRDHGKAYYESHPR